MLGAIGFELCQQGGIEGKGMDRGRAHKGIRTTTHDYGTLEELLSSDEEVGNNDCSG